MFGFHKVIFNFHLASPIYHLQDISNLEVLLLCWPSRNRLLADARMSLQANTSCNLQREKMLMDLRLSHQQLQTELSSGTYCGVIRWRLRGTHCFLMLLLSIHEDRDSVTFWNIRPHDAVSQKIVHINILTGISNCCINMVTELSPHTAYKH